MGHAYRWKSRRLVGGNYLYAVAPNFHSRQSRGRGHVAGIVYDAGTLGLLRANRKSRIENRESENKMVVALLYLPRVWIFGERTDRVDAALNNRGNEIFRARYQTCAAFQIRTRHFAHARNRCAVGGAGTDSNSWRVF